MKFLVFLVSLALASPAFAIPGPIQGSSLAAGGGGVNDSSQAITQPQALAVTPANLSNVITLVGGINSSNTSAYYSFLSAGGSGGSATYCVPANKTLYCLEENLIAPSGNGAYVGYSTATFTTGTTSAPTGAVDLTPTFLYSNVASKYTRHPFILTWSASTCPYWRADTASVSYRHVWTCLLL